MADFPFTPGMGSERTPRAGSRVDFDGDNVPRRRSLGPEKYDYKVVLPVLSDAQYSTLQAFFDTNQQLTWNLTWANGQVVAVKFGAGRPKEKFLGKGVGWSVEFMAHGL